MAGMNILPVELWPEHKQHATYSVSLKTICSEEAAFIGNGEIRVCLLGVMGQREVGWGGVYGGG